MADAALGQETPVLYGLMAEFTTPDEVVAAAKRAVAAGYTKLDCYTPYPIEELGEILGHHSPLPSIVLGGGIVGLLGGWGLEYWASTIAYPMNIGGRPFNSWVSFIPVAFETTVLLAAFSAVLGMLALNGLPEPYHPVFNVPTFALASKDRFFLCIEAKDPRYDFDKTWSFLLRLSPRAVSEVEP